MVLRKSPPPGIQLPSRARTGSESREPVSQSSTSPRSANSHHPPRKDSWELDTESIYSPDLRTSPAFDLRPLEEAQRSPVMSHSPWEDELVERPAGMTPLPATSSRTLERVQETPAKTATYQNTGSSMTTSEDGVWTFPSTEDAGLGASPHRLRSNNPFLRARNPSPNPWDDNSKQDHSHSGAEQNSAMSSLNPNDDHERNSQSSGFIPMTARLSLLDQAEDPWNSSNSQHGAETAAYTSAEVTQMPDKPDATKNPSEDREQANTYTLDRGDDWDLENQWQELTLHSTQTAEVPNSLTTSHIPKSTSSPPLIDLETTPTNVETNPWSGEEQPNPPTKNALNSQSSVSDSNIQDPLPEMSEAELKSFQAKQGETYAIRHINWTDHTEQLRESPVLVQSKNGPCPLLALVNGLVMRSDREAQPPIVRAMQTREHISLGLLIQALFDELVTYSSEELPDIEALSRFLTMLHTGMNVNPRLTLSSTTTPGSFFENRDIRLYDSFKVPLVHGWLAEPTSKVHDAFIRTAQYYEDIQLLHFRREELEDRVLHAGEPLTFDEERLLNDIQLIDQFVNFENTTQLTEFGLGHLNKSLPPGSISILFRNDHFSTLYKHPQSEQLFTLVTDAGYADHAEVVWESLVDITGGNTEYYSGDFRPVGHGPSVPPRTTSRNDPVADTSIPSQQSTEQKDADYAYALSLQFQEEEQQQRQQRQPANRSDSTRVPISTPNSAGRNSTPAHQYSQSTSSVPSTRARNHNSSISSSSLRFTPTSSETNPAHNVPQDVAPGNNNNNNDDDLADDAPPPSYEQVARNKAAETPPRYPPRGQQQQQQQQQGHNGFGPNMDSSAYRGQYPGASPNATGRRQPLQSIPDRRPQTSRDKDCIVM